ncbi:hypothetical protein MC885_004587 [Smutsia gigantea]|nr:hypothetical protein MC885_004587 [Smutsia gigantea]
MLLRARPGLPVPPPLVLLLGPLGPFLAGAPAGPVQAEDAAELDFSTERPLHLLHTLAKGLSPGYLRFGGTKTDFLIFDPNKEPTFEERSYWQSQVNRGEYF